ncbi:LpxI family protein [Ancylobacter terrae]|uniref:LpxI family protein n=1 Tax=Ancylobacter sp. sgz301288 TaxID=3342077 RepID=UPI00385F228A
MAANATPPEPAPAGAPLAIICGGGAFPLAVAEAAERGGRQVVMLGLKGFADSRIERWPHLWIPLGRFGAVTAELRRRGCRDIVFIGTALRPRLSDIRLDWKTLRLMPQVARLMRGGDDHLLSGVARLFEREGFRLLGAHEVAPDLLLPAGRLGTLAPTPADERDIAIGFRALAAMSPHDVGQGLVVIDGHIVAVEAAEGTDLMLARVVELRLNGRLKVRKGAGVLVKRPKAGQDRRLDLPSLGPRTVEGVARAGLAGLAMEAGGVIVTDIEGTVRAADTARLFVVGIDGTAAAPADAGPGA